MSEKLNIDNNQINHEAWNMSYESSTEPEAYIYADQFLLDIPLPYGNNPDNLSDFQKIMNQQVLELKEQVKVAHENDMNFYEYFLQQRSPYEELYESPFQRLAHIYANEQFLEMPLPGKGVIKYSSKEQRQLDLDVVKLRHNAREAHDKEITYLENIIENNIQVLNFHQVENSIRLTPMD